ncbi:MAG: asparagine synthase (glutamine-hydrolyzing) [Patescibacteria group bacterium]|nr:asparagine synthase (glutamine-hydrolyzing) [Patescibacteria group bacterium]
MCGISGVYQNKSVKIEEIKKSVGKMNNIQAFRGPDDEGIFLKSLENGRAVALGHRRLSILDLSKAGKQPMRFMQPTTKNIWITFNGEIYNFLELRKDLEKKNYEFKTHTDTEVILALYAEYGNSSFSMLRGMFSFGLWDEKNKNLFLVRDRYGIKPLYYFSDKEKLVFASTVKAISGSGLIHIEKNPKAMIGFLLFGSVPFPHTTVKDVLPVPPGHYIQRSADGSEKIIKYYDSLDFFLEKSNDDFDTAAYKIKELLTSSVNHHLISDTSLGIFLSGGLDSSALTVLAAEQRKKPITTISIVFEEEEFSEKKYQRMVANSIKSEHREIKIIKNDFEKSFDEIFEAMDQPTIDGVNTFFIAKVAKEAGVKTVLSGLGSDEIFMGYPSFKKAVLLKKIQKLPGILKFSLRIFSLFSGRLAKLNYLKKDTPLNFYLAVRGLFTPKETAKILNISEQDVNNFISDLEHQQFNDLTIEQLNELHPADLLSYLELKFYLQNQLLKDTDFMSMRHSIEIRVPFLDHPLVEYLSSLKPKIKLGKTIKPLLVETIRELLSKEIFDRPKMGFTFPFQKWLSGADNNSIPKLHWSRFWAKTVLNKF